MVDCVLDGYDSLGAACLWAGAREGVLVLAELRLGEFAGWGAERVLRLAPITLFLGSNGSGKSALLRAVIEKVDGPKPKLLPGRLRRGDRELEETLGHWLTAMGIIDDFLVIESGEWPGFYGLKVKVRGSEAYVPAGRAGAGAQHALLVLVRAFARTTKAPAHLDHPESRLQPSAQSALGDALLAAAKVRGNQLLVETHSERLLRRIQRRIAEGRASTRDVAAYLIKGRDNDPEIQELAITEYGHITNWPEKFFGDETSDLIAIASAAAERRPAVARSAGAQ